MDYKDIKFSIKEKIALITLDRPEHKNAFSAEMLSGWADALNRSQEDPEVNVIILTGQGGSFCAGADIRDFLSRHPSPWDLKRFIQQNVHPVAEAVQRLDKPLIAAVNGAAYGAGMDMALLCDIRIASEEAVFCESYIKLGLAPGDGGAYLLPRLVGTAKALELLLTGRSIDSDEALSLGLVSRVVAREKLMDEALNMAGQMARHSPLGIRFTKKAVYQSFSSNLLDHLDHMSSQLGLLSQTDYFLRAVDDFCKKNPPT